MKAIEAIDDDGRVVHTFKSIREAARYKSDPAAEKPDFHPKLIRDVIDKPNRFHRKLRWRTKSATSRPAAPVRKPIDGTHRVFEFIAKHCEPARASMKWNHFKHAFSEWLRDEYAAEWDRARLPLILIDAKYRIEKLPGGPRMIENLQLRA